MRAFAEMLAEGEATPNAFVLAAVVRCCAGMGDVESGKRVHGWMLRNGVHLDVVLCNAVLDMYAKCGQFERARRVFGAMAERDAVSWNIAIGACIQSGDILGSMQLFDESPLRDTTSWNTIISGLMRSGHAADALSHLRRMAQAGVVFNHYTYSTAFVLAGMLLLPDLGRQLHGRVLIAALEGDAFVRSSLMDMYCKCGLLEAAASVFDHWSPLTRDMNFAWSTMVAGYVQNGREEEALDLFRRMLREGVAADRFTLTSVAAACANVGMVEQGRQVHGCVEKLWYKLDAPLASAIVDMYAKCGNLEDARSIFDRACTKNIAVWTSMLCSYASHGQGRIAIELFERMTAKKMTPNEITLVGVLSACSHVGLVSEGELYFKQMQEEYGIVPSIEHYNCIVDLYGRSGLLDKAKNFIEENNINHEAIVWKTLLSACRLHQHNEYAKLASEKLVQLEQCDAGSYVMLSNIYATNNKWHDTFELRVSMQERKVRKQPGRSWIHLKNTVHTFVAGDASHPQSAEIYAYLEKLVERLKEIGYTSRTDLVVHDVEDEQRETALKFHSEKLAIAFGIISTPSGTPLRIFKNLRVCEDCHEAIKYISLATVYSSSAEKRINRLPHLDEPDILTSNYEPLSSAVGMDYSPFSKAVVRQAVDNLVKASNWIILIHVLPRGADASHKELWKSTGSHMQRHCNFSAASLVQQILTAASLDKSFLTFIDKCIEVCKESREGSHLNPSSGLFQPNEKKDVILSCGWILSHTCTIMAMKKLPWHHGRVNNIINVVGLLFVNDARMATRVLFPFLQAECLDLWAKILNWVIQVRAIRLDILLFFSTLLTL
uniref:DYW domain-containing protein n=1 Tax=Oryza barthii TaxID=65489 RepID=A0A0D3GP07_9ORYZ